MNAGLRNLAESLGVPTLVTGDVHAHHQRRAPLQDVLVAVRNRSSLDGCEAVICGRGGGSSRADSITRAAAGCRRILQG